jgi:acetyl esterase
MLPDTAARVTLLPRRYRMRKMSTPALERDIEVTDVEYFRHGARPLLARLYRPRQGGPHPLIVDLHGGVWCKLDRTRDVAIAEPLARSGIAVASLDFRMPPEAGYPASLADINCAIRWLKSQAGRFGLRADRVGILGCSSGGHQAMLTAMRPRDPRYAALRFPGDEAFDASVRCAVLCWPVIDPLGRYHYALKLKERGNSAYADHALPLHHQYWPDESAMAEASPLLALERGESLGTPPVLYLQGTADGAHPRPLLDRFVSAYRKAGASVELHFFEGATEAFINTEPASPASMDALGKIVAFTRRQLAA